MKRGKTHKNEPPHHGQIITTRKGIRNELGNQDIRVTTQMLIYIGLGPDHPDYTTHLVAVSMRLWFIEKLVYMGKSGNWKPTADYYMKELFEGFGETAEECKNHLNDANIPVNNDTADRIHACLWKIAKLVSPMVACQKEMLSPSEIAYSIDYVIRNNDTLSDPEFDNKTTSIPWHINYPGFEITDLSASVEKFIDPTVIWHSHCL